MFQTKLYVAALYIGPLISYVHYFDDTKLKYIIFIEITALSKVFFGSRGHMRVPDLLELPKTVEKTH